MHLAAEEAGEVGGAGQRVGPVAGIACEALEELEAALCRRRRDAAGEPLLERRRLHDDDRADHPRVERPAVLGAEEMVRPRHRRLEPGLGVAAGQRVLLHAERRHVEAVDHVLRRQQHLHRPRDRHVQLVDLPLAAQMLELPHPLLADAVELERVGRRRVREEEHVRAPDVREEKDDERDDAPGDLEPVRAVDLRRTLVAGTPAVADREVEDQRRDQDAHEAAHREEIEEKVIGPRREGRGLRRKDRERQEATHVAFPSWRRSTTMRPASATAVSTAPTRTMRAISGV